MAKRTASDAALPERGGGGGTCCSDIITSTFTSSSSSTPLQLHCNICFQQLQSNNEKSSSSQFVQDFRTGISFQPQGHNLVHLSCLVNNAAQSALTSFSFLSWSSSQNNNTDTTAKCNQLNHMSNTFHNFLDNTLSTNGTKTNKNDVNNNMFHCLSYTFLLSNLDRMIESERLLQKLISTSDHLFGSHHNSCTQAAELALLQKKLRFVIVEEKEWCCVVEGKKKAAAAAAPCVFRALRYDDENMECCVLQGPIENNNYYGCGGGGVSFGDDIVGGEQPQTQQQQQQQQQQILMVPSKSIIPTIGTPVICHGCINHQTYLNGKIGDVRSINKITNECQVHFESITMEPQLIKVQYLRIVFDLPPNQNLDYNFCSEECIGEQYKLVERVGKGEFGQVVRALDTQRNNEEVAIKIIKRSGPKQNFLLQAQTEIGLLRRICEKQEESLGWDNHHIVRLLDTLMHKDHQCIVFEPLAMTLYQLLAATKFRGLNLDMVRTVAKQLLQALAYLARPDVDIIHCDLKPENVMLETLECKGVKLIDFGSACKSNEKTYTYIQSRFYRSPEVILGLSYSVAIDMWSLGCMLVELYTGEPLFAGSDGVNMIHRFVAILGMLPDEMIHQVKKNRQRQFFQKKEGKWTIKQSTGGKTNAITTPSHNPKASLKEAITRACAYENLEKSPEEHDSFVDMIFQMLTYLPQNRINPEEGLQHPFIVEKVNVNV